MVVLVIKAFASQPQTVMYQGYIFDDGQPINNTRTMQFKLVYDDNTGTEIETWNSGDESVNIVNGIYTYLLGTKNQTAFLNINWNQQIYLRVTIGNKVLDRVPFKTVTHAMHAIDASSIGGTPANQIIARLEDLERRAAENPRIFLQTSEVEYLVVGGGGGGGVYNRGGGGGGGGVLEGSMMVSNYININVTVGAGGVASGNGGASSFYTVTAGGGQGGGVSGRQGGTSGSPQQNSGGAELGYQGGGGGGALYSGGNARVGHPDVSGVYSGYYAGDGGAGKGSVYFGGTYAGGGGGGADYWGNHGHGGVGGGGDGGQYENYNHRWIVPAQSGSPNTGGGGGGAGNGTFTPGGGGSGIVIIRYLGSQIAEGGSITIKDGYTIHTFYSSGTFRIYR